MSTASRTTTLTNRPPSINRISSSSSCSSTTDLFPPPSRPKRVITVPRSSRLVLYRIYGICTTQRRRSKARKQRKTRCFTTTLLGDFVSLSILLVPCILLLRTYTGRRHPIPRIFVRSSFSYHFAKYFLYLVLNRQSHNGIKTKKRYHDNSRHHHGTNETKLRFPHKGSRRGCCRICQAYQKHKQRRRGRTTHVR